ncbi:MAG: hypothetical protein OT477_14795 [Chloroflexi bacterium]|nr:hypothetical protein [Chloroflexota bacterium]
MPNEYTPPAIIDLPLPRRVGRWRQQAAIHIVAVIALHRDAADLAAAGDASALKQLKKRISKAYPFGERAMHPYKAWCEEVKYQLNQLSHGKVINTAEDIKYKLVGGKPPAAAKHIDSGLRCLVAHFDESGELLPPCIKCGNCSEWLRPDEFEEGACEWLSVNKG